MSRSAFLVEVAIVAALFWGIVAAIFCTIYGIPGGIALLVAVGCFLGAWATLVSCAGTDYDGEL